MTRYRITFSYLGGVHLEADRIVTQVAQDKEEAIRLAREYNNLQEWLLVDAVAIGV